MSPSSSIALRASRAVVTPVKHDAQRVVQALGGGVQALDELLEDQGLVVDHENAADRVAHAGPPIHGAPDSTQWACADATAAMLVQACERCSTSPAAAERRMNSGRIACHAHTPDSCPTPRARSSSSASPSRAPPSVPATGRSASAACMSLFGEDQRISYSPLRAADRVRGGALRGGGRAAGGAAAGGLRVPARLRPRQRAQGARWAGGPAPAATRRAGRRGRRRGPGAAASGNRMIPGRAATHAGGGCQAQARALMAACSRLL